ncbi:MAG: ABC transporter ATP-binding protein/permease [Anaerolineae bacterium]|nr:ABC transporter ATP-binding protein/permease [Anaerolineae bacterium]
MSLPIKKYLAYYRPYRRLLLADIACAVIVAVITLILPLIARAMTEYALNQQMVVDPTPLYFMGFVMTALIAIQTLCNTFVDYQGHLMGALIESDLRVELFDHYQSLSFRFYDEHHTGQLMSRLTHDLWAVSELYHHGPEEGIIAILKFSGAFILLLMIHVPLTLCLFVFLPIMGLYSLYYNRQMNAALQRSRQRIGDVNRQVEETLAGIRVVKSFTNESLEREKFDRENRRFVESRKDGYRSEAYFYAGIGVFTQMLTVVVISLGSVAILTQSLTPADLVTYLLFVAILIDPIQKFTNLARLYQEGITGLQRFHEIITISPEIQDPLHAIELGRVQGQIELIGVTFRYQGDQAEVLREVSFTIQAGESIALVGSSGVGKTTLCSLIPRFYEVTTGEIRIDGIPIQAVSLASLRRNIGIVQQDVYLFSGTIYENICYGQPNATDEQIIAAAKKANAHDFIMTLPHGYHTEIGQRGVQLSGGQKQRLSLARVFLKDPPVIILDEATSALDYENERVIQESLGLLAQDRTMIVIAHRLSTVKNADRIVVLTDQGISEQGTHDDLIAIGGRYATLYQAQLDL